ncbi:MAG: hypothetical protein HYX73_02220 [Acidobacteria bacterium]|nr:hypothetical protein [Acidobacteriota bacterium]
MAQAITIEQNTTKQLERLAAQRQLYARAKNIQGWQMILSVPAVIAWSLAVVTIPFLKVWAALWGAVLTILDILWLNPWQRSLKRKAAKVQEQFDCDVLQMDWDDFKVGRKPDAELILNAADQLPQKEAELQKLRDWYPSAVESLPIHLGRIVCQRANCWWDADLRRRYANWRLIALGLMCTIVVILSLVGGFTLEKFILAALVPLMPAIILGLRQSREHREAAERADRLKAASEDLWQLALSSNATDEQLSQRSRQLQDAIYEHRSNSPLIFDWIYNRLRRSYEELMNKAAVILVQEAVQAKGRPNKTQPH